MGPNELNEEAENKTRAQWGALLALEGYKRGAAGELAHVTKSKWRTIQTSYNKQYLHAHYYMQDASANDYNSDSSQS